MIHVEKNWIYYFLLLLLCQGFILPNLANFEYGLAKI